MSGSALSPKQRGAAQAREALNSRFPNPEAKSEYFRELAQPESERRRGGVFLSRDEAAALAEAYSILQGVAQRVRKQEAANGAS